MTNPCAPDIFSNIWLVIGEWLIFAIAGYISYKYNKNRPYPIILFIIPFAIVFDSIILKYDWALSFYVNIFLAIFMLIGWHIGLWKELNKTKVVVFTNKKGKGDRKNDMQHM